MGGGGKVTILTAFWQWGLKGGKSHFIQHLMSTIVEYKSKKQSSKLGK